MSTLVIVDRLAKARTLGPLLDYDWHVEATLGPLRDFPASSLGVVVEKDFSVLLETLSGKAATVRRLDDAIGAAETIYLATDPDARGEWLASEVLNIFAARLRGKLIRRVRLAEVSAQAWHSAMAAAETVDARLTAIHHTWRVADRLAGCIASAVAADRLDRPVSVWPEHVLILRALLSREAAIESFQSRMNWTLDARLRGEGDSFPARVWIGGRGRGADQLTDRFVSRAALDQVVNQLSMDGIRFRINKIETVEQVRDSPSLFTASSLAQAGAAQLAIPPTLVLRTALDLYDAGLITYPYTEGTAMDPLTLTSVFDVLYAEYGYESLGAGPATGTVRGIYPIVPDRPLGEIAFDNGVQRALYTLIRSRLLVACMSPLRYWSTQVQIRPFSGDTLLTGMEMRVNQRSLISAGFTQIYPDQGVGAGTRLNLEVGALVSLVGWSPGEYILEAPIRFTAASLLEWLDQQTLGRTIEYATALDNLLQSGFIQDRDGMLLPTVEGRQLDHLIAGHFPFLAEPGWSVRLEQAIMAIVDNQNVRDVLGMVWHDLWTALSGTAADFAAV